MVRVPHVNAHPPKPAKDTATLRAQGHCRLRSRTISRDMGYQQLFRRLSQLLHPK